MAKDHPRSRTVFLYSMLFASFLAVFMPAHGIGQIPDQARRESILNAIPQSLVDRLAAGEPQDVIVEFDSANVEAEAAAVRSQRGLTYDDHGISEYKAQRFRQIKNSAFAQLPAAEVGVLIDYSHLPMALLRLRSPSAMARLVGLSQVAALYENRTIYPYVAPNLQLINQPQAASAGYTGAGTTVAVLDTGVNYTVADFGPCTSPGVPSGCKVIATVILGNDSNPLDSNGHGTNVAGIVVAVAPDAKVAAVHVFNTDGTSTDALVIDGIDWAISNKSAYNIVAINMSLGDGSDNTSPCSNRYTNPFVTPVSNARGAGILPVAASGNNGYTSGIGSPACTPGIISVGAVYDADIGGVSYGFCTDSTTAADQVTCFSNSAYFLTMLAPGAAITAGGYTDSGTSQATPHVAGAVAVLRSAYPSETLDSTTTRLTATGRPITDPRNNVTTPRVDVYAVLELALAPVAVPALSSYGLWGAVLALALLGATTIRPKR
ncbi:MAG TPA: S8 family serine peptidase [Syntrophorhabdales bacterium]|nr:S8 family serine peptidase [Syntrophorhabdales bacterium]